MFSNFCSFFSRKPLVKNLCYNITSEFIKIFCLYIKSSKVLTRQGYKQAIDPACLFKPLVARAFDNVMSLRRSVKVVKLPSVMKEDNYTVC